MRIFINGRFLTQPVTGVQRYATEVVKALDNLFETDKVNKEEYELIILAPKNIINDLSLKHIEIKKIGNFNGHFWEQTELPFYVKNSILINLCNAGPILKRNQATVIHDMAVFAYSLNFSFIFKIWYKILISLQGKFSRQIITVSNFSKEELIKYLSIDKQKINVIYEGKEHFINKNVNTSILNKYELDLKPYIFAVSSLNPNKNFKAIVEATKLLETEELNIVIAGGTDPKVFSGNGITLPGNVKYLGYISDEELKALYESAFCFIYPSFYEGFGLPPLEAMSVGCPVIASDRASLPEVIGDAALYCDPSDPKTIANKIETLIRNNNLRNELIDKGRMQSEKYSWGDTAQKIVNIVTQNRFR